MICSVRRSRAAERATPLLQACVWRSPYHATHVLSEHRHAIGINIGVLIDSGRLRSSAVSKTLEGYNATCSYCATSALMHQQDLPLLICLKVLQRAQSLWYATESSLLPPVDVCCMEAYDAVVRTSEITHGRMVKPTSRHSPV